MILCPFCNVRLPSRPAEHAHLFEVHMNELRKERAHALRRSSYVVNEEELHETEKSMDEANER